MLRILPAFAMLGVLLACTPLAAQDPHFSKFFATPIYLNPAYTGFSPGTAVTLNHHEQWQGIPDGDVNASPTGYRTINATADQQIPCLFKSCKVRGGLALSVFHDAAGSVPLNTLGAGLAASFGYRFQCSASNYIELRLGWQGSFMQRSLSNDYLIYSDQLDSRFGLIGDPTMMNLRARYFNHNVGFMARFVEDTYLHWTVGASISNLLVPNQSLLEAPAIDPLPRRYTFHAGGTRDAGRMKRGNKYVPMYFCPQVRWDVQANGQLNLLTGGAYYQSNQFYSGAFLQGNFKNYKVPNATPTSTRFNPGILNLSLTAGVDIVKLTRKLDYWDAVGRRLIIGLTYDMSLTSIPNATTLGGLELNFRMNFVGDQKRSCRSIPGDVGRCPVIAN